MPQNDFLAFAGDSGANVLAQAAYAALGARSAGFSAGTASSAQFNKVLRQTAAMTAMIGEFVKTIGGLDALDNGDIAALLANFIASLDKRSSGSRTGAFLTVSASPSATPAASPADGDEYPVAAGATAAWNGKDGQIARWNAATSSWSFDTCRLGRLVRIGSTDTFYQRVSGGWNAYTFGANVNPTVAWGGITGLLNNQADLSNALAGMLKLAPPGNAEQVVSGAIHSKVGANGYFAIVPGWLTTNSGYHAAFSPSARIGYGGFWDGTSYIAAMTDGAVPVVIGTDGYIRATFNAQGLTLPDNLRATRAKVDAVDYLGAGGVTNWTTYQDANTWTLHSYARGGTVLALTKEGAVGLCGDVGVPGRVIASQGSGQPAAWALPLDLISASDLRAKLGGQTVWACVNCWGSKPANGTTPGNLLARGCTVTTNEFSSGNPVMVVTFSTPAPNASYVVMPDNGAVSAKTANGFTYALGNLNTSIVDLEVYL